MKLRLLLAALLLPLLSLPIVASVAHAEGPSLRVTFPDTSALNPDTTTYTVHVESDEPSAELSVLLNLEFDSNVIELPVPASGDVVVDFPTDGSWLVGARACNPGGDCTREPLRYVEVHSALDVFVSVTQQHAGPGQEAKAEATASFAGDSAEFTWTLAPASDPDLVLATGSSTVVRPAHYYGYLETRLRGLRLPEGGPDGPYVLRVHAVSETDDYGVLEGDEEGTIRWDATAPAPVGFSLSGTDIYPARDGYRDSVKLTLAERAGTNELAVRVTSAAGEVVDEHTVGRNGLTSTFDGRAGGRPLPAGTYTVEVVTTDRSGNSSSTSREVQLHAEQLVWQEVGRTFKASKVLVDRFVGRCGSLVKSPKGQPKGTLGYYSNATCGDSREGTVATVLGVTLPPAYQGRYRDFRVTAIGGAARSARKSRASMSYYQPSDKRYHYRATLKSKQGRHRGQRVGNGTNVVVESKKSSSVYWSVGTGGGNRYDVRSFTVEMERQVLTLPSSSRSMSRTASEAKTIAEPSGAPGPG